MLLNFILIFSLIHQKYACVMELKIFLSIVIDALKYLYIEAFRRNY